MTMRCFCDGCGALTSPETALPVAGEHYCEANGCAGIARAAVAAAIAPIVAERNRRRASRRASDLALGLRQLGQSVDSPVKRQT